METRQGSTLQSLRTVDKFLDEHAAALGDVINSGVRKELTEIISELTGHIGAQTSGGMESYGATRKQRALRAALLRDQMAPIATVARARLRHVPELAAFKMPRGRPTTERLASVAYGMAKEAAKHADVFTEAGLSTSFVANLTSAADALVDSLSGRTNTVARRRGATRDLKEKLTAGRKVVAILNAMIKRELKTNEPGLLDAWNVARRVKKLGEGTIPLTPGQPMPSAPGQSTPSPAAAVAA